ncbi:hypothetical protein DL764_009634 [Monosporascus ibericus]|uniref:Uncharacterized protein n=1 Tax=Monosporascus ibericus TaxID=155417 RepID=A0A4V1X8X4_9PEZI|nr:hypothetical protein DL764_009634 [Monosporascus ibericus]
MGTMTTFLCLLLAATAANGEYSSYCGRPTLLLHDDAPFLGSLCDGGPKGAQCAELDISLCYRNKGGELAASKESVDSLTLGPTQQLTDLPHPVETTTTPAVTAVSRASRRQQ